MQDARYVTELINRHNAGVPVRILVDQRANHTYPLNETLITTLRDAGIPMREKFAGAVIPSRTRDGRNWDSVGGSLPDPFAKLLVEIQVGSDAEVVLTDTSY